MRWQRSDRHSTPSQESHILYIATNDYIFKTRDGGKTWSNLTKGMSHSRVIGDEVDPAYPATVYAGTKVTPSTRVTTAGSAGFMRAGLDDATISSVVNQFIF
ncbi:MAG: hypothetical protein U0361_16390 [Nitrospiraceae bacterium]